MTPSAAVASARTSAADGSARDEATTTTAAARLPARLARKFQRGKALKFPLNDEATSLQIDPVAGSFVCAGFTDGTIRLFDLTGQFSHLQLTTHPASPGVSGVVDSKRHQRYGAVAGQIHAKGVHTSLRMHVEVSEDGLWCFAGVLRGSMELVAIHLGDLQQAYRQAYRQARESPDHAPAAPNLLDHVTIFRLSDAKLRGFGACTRLAKSTRYLLFTGRSIKNIHIWSFDPPTKAGQEPTVVPLYDTSTNGNTIRFLQFRRHATSGALQAISKSDDQRLRVWDLTAEEEGLYNEDPSARPSRPPFEDVPHTKGTLAVAGGLCLCGGAHMFNQMSLVSLNVANLQSPYNHTELALPGAAPSPVPSRRAQRGDLKSLQAAYGSLHQARHVLLEISDGSLCHYRQGEEGHGQLLQASALPWPAECARYVTVGSIAGWSVAVVALYQPGGGRGQLSVWALEEGPAAALKPVVLSARLSQPTLAAPKEPVGTPNVAFQATERLEDPQLAAKPIPPTRNKTPVHETVKEAKPVGTIDAPSRSKSPPTRTVKQTPPVVSTAKKAPPTATHTSGNENGTKLTPIRPQVVPATQVKASRPVVSTMKKASREARASSPLAEQHPAVVHGTAPKPTQRRTAVNPLITPTPQTKFTPHSPSEAVETWQQVSISTAALALSSLKKQSPKASEMQVETPLIARRLETETTSTLMGELPLEQTNAPPTSEKPLPAPRVLNPAKSSKVARRESRVARRRHSMPPVAARCPTPTRQSVSEGTCVSPPTIGGKRKCVEEKDSGSLQVQTSIMEESSQKRVKTAGMEWLRQKIVLRGRKDDEHLRRAISNECARQRVAIETKVRSLSSDRPTDSMGSIAKLQTEQQAAFLFLEKKVWRTVRSLLQSVERSPSGASLRESESLLRQLLDDYKQTAVRGLTL
jgi:hypothetical protein